MNLLLLQRQAEKTSLSSLLIAYANFSVFNVNNNPAPYSNCSTIKIIFSWSILVSIVVCKLNCHLSIFQPINLSILWILYIVNKEWKVIFFEDFFLVFLHTVDIRYIVFPNPKNNLRFFLMIYLLISVSWIIALSTI